MASVVLPVEKESFSPLAQRVLEPISRVAYFRLPLKNRFRRVTEREGLLLEGPAGWAEVSPFWDYDARESAHWLQAGLELACEKLALPVYRQQIPINVTIPVVAPERALEIVEEFLVSVPAGQVVTAKVKVADPGVTLAADCARLEAVRAGLGACGRIRVDANAAWTVEEAVSALRELDKAAGGLEYVEQPCAAVEDLALVRRLVEVPVAADESVRRAEDPLRVARLDAADVLVVKLQPMAGIHRILQVTEQAQLPVVVSSALDSSVGIAAGLRLAAHLPQLDYACGLGTARMFIGDVVASPLIPEGGFLPVTSVEPDWPQVSALTSSGFDRERITAWVQRLNSMVEYL
ncbi:o-succinylbenzoate synthase [Gleimia coleocanis]|uniref:o-succinylbenzoate synthase n=1 Tax=Gleimia coleocanis TaxID=103618 RepID=UPI0002F5D252|nr:o-succinylbenzoate synthase [Gleimia coleocanis]